MVAASRLENRQQETCPQRRLVVRIDRRGEAPFGQLALGKGAIMATPKTNELDQLASDAADSEQAKA
jgi:hypothetical protein